MYVYFKLFSFAPYSGHFRPGAGGERDHIQQIRRLVELPDPPPLGPQTGGEGAEDDAGLVIQGKDQEGCADLLLRPPGSFRGLRRDGLSGIAPGPPFGPASDLGRKLRREARAAPLQPARDPGVRVPRDELFLSALIDPVTGGYTLTLKRPPLP